MNVGMFSEAMAVRNGGTATAFMNTVAALRTRTNINLRMYSAPPDDSTDPSMIEVNEHPEQWTLIRELPRGLRAGPMGRALVSDIASGRIDLLHIHGLWSADMLAAAKACRRAGVPYVWEVHGMLLPEAFAQKKLKKQVFMALGLRRALAAAAAIVFVTHDEMRTSILPRAVGPDRKRVIPLPVSIPSIEVSRTKRDLARVRLGVPSGEPVILFMGRLHEVKRIDLAIRALQAASQTHPDMHLVIVGGGNDELESRLRSLAKDLSVQERVHFVGWKIGEDKWLALAAADVLTLQSVHENFGFVVFEGLCMGARPAITSNLSIVEELRGTDLVEIAQSDAAALARAWIRGLGRDPAQVARDGQAWVQQHLSNAAVGAALEDLYAQSILSCARARQEHE